MPPQLQEKFALFPEAHARQQNALRTFDAFHAQFVQAKHVEVNGKRYSPASLVAVGVNSANESKKMLVTIHTAAATEKTDVLIASTDGEQTLVREWSVTKMKEYDDVTHRDQALYVHRWHSPSFWRTVVQLERTNEEGSGEFAKLILWDDGRCELYNQEAAGELEVLFMPIDERAEQRAA